MFGCKPKTGSSSTSLTDNVISKLTSEEDFHELLGSVKSSTSADDDKDDSMMVEDEVTCLVCGKSSFGAHSSFICKGIVLVYKSDV